MKKLALGALFAGLTACGGGSSSDGIILPDSTTVDAVSVCSPLTQMGCATGEKCAWIEDQAEPPIGHIGCAPAGAVAIGGVCNPGTPGPMGYSDCVAGAECVAGTCKQICDHQGGAPTCDSNHACGRYEGLFESGDTTVAGVCDPKCDPLTQALLAGTTTAACGSPDPAAPNGGCFTFDDIDFTCAPVGPSTLPLTDRMPARTSPSGAPYVNGCAPGFRAMFVESTGSTTAICSGMCAPANTDNSAALRANVSGNPAAMAKLPTKAAPEAGDGICVANKKGSAAPNIGQNCLFMWAFNFENGMLIDTPYNDTLGICFDYRSYSYDRDNNTGTPNEPIPSCANLPPKAASTATCTCDANGNNCTGVDCPDGQAHEWGCYDTTKTDAAPAFTSGKSPLKPALRDIRVGNYGEGEGVRHLIR